MAIVIVGLAGLLVGAAIGWAVAARQATHGSPGPEPAAGFGMSSVSAPLHPSGQGPPPEELERMKEMWLSLARVESAPLERVVACGQAATVGELAVELIVVELRGPGGQLLIHWRRPGFDLTRPSMQLHPSGRPRFNFPGQPEVVLADDLGTTYQAMPGGRSASGASGQAQVRFVPAVPPEARRLSVTVERFGGGWQPPEAPEELAFEGPWRFEVPLERPLRE